jgi:DNA-binding MarR family transcriptional regulator/GNAT superfamily N-acetyltransferase
MAGLTFAERVEAIRHFNRFYTQHVNLLNEKYLRSLFSVAEARVIYELARRGTATATELSSELHLDPGYASRILRRMGKRGLVDGQPFEKDGRRTLLRLTPKGKETFGRLDSRARESTGSLLGSLSDREQDRLVGAMRSVEALLSPPDGSRRNVTIRPRGPGDLGWAVQRHGRVFSQEYDWDIGYEGQVAARAAEFLCRRDPVHERFLMAELDGEAVGCVMVTARSDAVAELGLLLVDPAARGRGIGARLLTEAVDFAREAGYRKLALSASHILSAANHLFEKAGFRVVGKKHVQDFGHYLTNVTWELNL